MLPQMMPCPWVFIFFIILIFSFFVFSYLNFKPLDTPYVSSMKVSPVSSILPW